ncbi:MAG: DUF2249 domain-containing protein [Nitrolancea sp.]
MRSSNTTQLEPIQASWKISDVIGRYPQLVDELAGLNATFRLLRNPVARRVQARLVTVAQAAQIAGMEPDNLVSVLNAAIGVTATEPVSADMPATAQSVDVPGWIAQTPVVEVDARALQRQSEEPFSAIATAMRKAAPGEVVRLRSTFEPVPLYSVLGQRGFEHFSQQVGEDDWEVLLYNAGRTRAPQAATATPPSSAVLDADWSAPDATITIDVSELVPPEPLVRIMEALEQLPSGGRLLVHHVRRPVHLYPQLDQSGYRHQTRELGPGRVELLIEKPGAR